MSDQRATFGRRLIITIFVAVIALTAWISFRFLYTAYHITEAYAAWDTGTLLVEYLKTHDDRWPGSWDDLLSVMNTESGRKLILQGASAGDLAYAQKLRAKVVIDWRFDPKHPGTAKPVTRPNGKPFPIIWEGAEPNEMVREYLKTGARTGESVTIQPCPSSGAHPAEASGFFQEESQDGRIEIIDALEPYAPFADVRLRQAITISLGEMPPLVGGANVDRHVLLLGRQTDDRRVSFASARISVVIRTISQHAGEDERFELRNGFADQLVEPADFRLPIRGEGRDVSAGRRHLVVGSHEPQ